MSEELFQRSDDIESALSDNVHETDEEKYLILFYIHMHIYLLH